MDINKVISRINYEINSFNESGGREDMACAEGLRRARMHIQQEVFKSKILTHDQQVVLEWLKEAKSRSVWSSPFGSLYGTIREHELTIRQLDTEQQFQVLQAFAEWGMKDE